MHVQNLYIGHVSKNNAMHVKKTLIGHACKDHVNWSCL